MSGYASLSRPTFVRLANPTYISKFMSELPQLILCKQLFFEAENLLQKSNGCAIGLSISVAQDAIELFLRSALKHRGIDTPKDKAGFSDAVSELSKDLFNKGDGSLPFRTKLDEINKARINFKHYGLSPIKTDASRLLDYAETFLIDATKLIFQLDYVSLSLAGLITNERIKCSLQDASKHLKNQDFKDSLCASALAVRLSIDEIGKALPQIERFNLAWRLPHDVRRDSGAKAIADSLENTLKEAFDSLKEIAILSGLTIDLLAYTKFKKLSPVVHQYSRERNSFEFTQFNTFSGEVEDVEFCCKFAIDFALAVQNRIQKI